MKINAVIMASGLSKRFGGNKLLYSLDGKPLAENILSAVKGSFIARATVVTRYGEIVALAQKYGFDCVISDDATDDLALTIKYGVERAKDADGIMLCVADQPYLTRESINELCNLFARNPDRICAVAHNGVMGNPVIFPKSLFGELLDLPPFGRGKDVIKRHENSLSLCEIPNGKELFDIDVKENLFNKEK